MSKNNPQNLEIKPSKKIKKSENFLEKYKKKAKIFAFFLSYFPGVSVVFLSGSLAQKQSLPGQKKSSYKKNKNTQRNKPNKNSDIDFFIISQKGQIFTTRFFVNLFLKLTFQLANHETNFHAGKICPNHFIPKNFLEIQEKNEYAASLFSNLIFLSGETHIAQKFFEINKSWMENFGFSIPPNYPLKKALTKNQKIKLIPKIWKIWLEKKVKNLQINRLKKRNQKSKITGDVWLRDNEIRLHPFPKKY